MNSSAHKQQPLSSKSILYVVHAYNNFQKAQIDLLARNFAHVYVLVRCKPIAELYHILPIKALSVHTRMHQIQLHNKPDNVTVIPVPLFYLPTKSGYDKLGEKHFSKASAIIEESGVTFDIIHSHFNWTAGYVGAQLKKKYNVPLIITSHSNNEKFTKEYNERFEQLSFIWKAADHIIRVNQATIKCISDINPQVTCLSAGFNAHTFFPATTEEISIIRKAKGISGDRTVLLNVGYLDSKKGQKYLIEALAILKKEKSDFVCYIIGDGPLYSSLKNLIAQNQLEQHIYLLGKLPNDEVADWMKACDLFVLPSLSESFGIVQAEAFGCGKPVVATRNGGSEEVVVSEDLGYLCNTADAHDLYLNIKKAISKEWNADTIYAYSENFSLEVICNEIHTVYKNLLSTDTI